MKSYYALCAVLDSLVKARSEPVLPQELKRATEAHLNFRLAAYGTGCFQPKAHYSLHFWAQLQRRKCLVSCCTHERKHKELKKWANFATNATRTKLSWEKSLLEDVVLQQLLVLEEWEPRKGVQLYNGRASSPELSELICRHFHTSGPITASWQAMVNGELIAKGDIVPYCTAPGMSAVGEIWFFFDLVGENGSSEIYACLSSWEPVARNKFRVLYEPSFTLATQLAGPKACKFEDGGLATLAP